MAANSLPSNMAPTSATVSEEDDSATMGAIYGYLGYINDKTGAVELSFLKSMTPSNGDRTWTLTLHPGIRFSDGTPFNAAAIAYTIAQQANPNNGYVNYAQERTWKTHVVNATTMTITLPTRDAQFPAEMTQDFPYISSPTAWRKEGTGFQTRPVGAGPFKLQSWTQNDQLTVVPNPYYSRFAPGQPYLSKVVFTLVNQSGPNELIATVQSGTDNAAWLEGSSEFSKARAAGFNVEPTVSSGGEYLLFNTAKAPFNNVLAREAVSYALSSTELAALWSPGTPPFNNLFSTTSPYYDSKYNFVSPNAAKATALFKKLQAQGVKMNFTFVTVSAFSQSADYVQATLDKYPGVHVSLALDNIDSYLQAATSGNFGLYAYGIDFANPWPALQQVFAANGAQNFGKWNDPVVQKALDVLATTQSPALEKKEYLAISKEVATQYPFFASQGAVLAYATEKSFQNVKTIEFGATPLLAQIWQK